MQDRPRSQGPATTCFHRRHAPSWPSAATPKIKNRNGALQSPGGSLSAERVKGCVGLRQSRLGVRTTSSKMGPQGVHPCSRPLGNEEAHLRNWARQTWELRDQSSHSNLRNTQFEQHSGQGGARTGEAGGERPSFDSRGGGDGLVSGLKTYQRTIVQPTHRSRLTPTADRLSSTLIQNSSFTPQIPPSRTHLVSPPSCIFWESISSQARLLLRLLLSLSPSHFRSTVDPFSSFPR